MRSLVSGLALSMALVAACETTAIPAGNDPVPLSPDLAEMIEADSSLRISPADASAPPISATQAVDVAGNSLLAELNANHVPAQDASVPDGLVRRVMTFGDRPPVSVWLVAYHWAAGFDCHGNAGGPGPCEATTFYVIDDRTGELITSYNHTLP